jgi:hypothetical protein
MLLAAIQVCLYWAIRSIAQYSWGGSVADPDAGVRVSGPEASRPCPEAEQTLNSSFLIANYS